MATGTTTIVPRTRLSIGIEAALHRELATRARGRVLVVDYFAGRRCGVVTGDLTANFRDQETRGSYLEGTRIEGVRIVVEERLLNVLEQNGPTLRLISSVPAIDAWRVPRRETRVTFACVDCGETLEVQLE